MMNMLALSLVLTTLLTASVHSPNAVKNQDVIVKEGHRVVKVEYDEEGDGNTKVSILKSDQADGHFGKSVKDMISGVVAGAKEKVKEEGELAKDVASKSKTGFWGAAETAKDSITNKAKQASDLAGDVKSRVEGGAKGAAEATKQGMKGTGEMARRGTEAVETTKILKRDVERNAMGKIHGVFEKVGRFCMGSFDKTRCFCMGLLHTMLGSMRMYMSVLQLFGFATAYGMAMWITFLSSFVLARELRRQQFATTQSKIYPLYFKAMAYSIGLALLGHLLSLLSEGGIKKFASLKNFQGLNLLSSLGMILANLLYLEPRVRKVMFERLKLEKEEGEGVEDTPETSPATEKTKATVTTETTAMAPPLAESVSDARPSKIIELSEALKKLHTYSSYLNVLTLMGLTLHLVHLGQRLGTTYY